MSNNDSIDNLLGLFESAFSSGTSLDDFMNNAQLNQTFIDVHNNLLNGIVPIKPTNELAYVKVVQKSTKQNSKLFEISLKSVIDIFECDTEITPIKKNRNITIYKGLLIHEAAHILEGSFEPINLKNIFKELGNYDLAHNIFNLIEDYRIEANISHKFRNTKPDYKESLEFLNTMLIGIPGNYKRNDFSNMMNSYLRQIKTGQSHSEILSAKGYTGTFKQELSRERLKKNGNYSTIDEVITDENVFFNKSTNEDLQKIKIYNYKDLLNTLIKKTQSLYLKDYITSVNLLPGIYNLLELAFPDNEKNNKSDKSKEEQSSTNNKSKKGKEEQSSTSSKLNKGQEKKSSTTYNPISTNDDFTQGSIVPESLDDFNSKADEIKARINNVAKNLSGAYKEKKIDLSNKNNQKKREASQDISHIFEYDNNNEKTKLTKVFWKKIIGEDKGLKSRINKKYHKISDKITEQFEELKLNQVQRLLNQTIPDTFNPVSLVYAAIDPNFGLNGKLFDTTIQNTKDYAIYYLIDASRSTDSTVETKEISPITQEEMTVLDIEKIAVASVYTGIENLELKDNFNQKIFLYNSYFDTTIYEAKNINQLGNISAYNANRDGAAIRALTQKIEDEVNHDKILFLFADGMPDAKDYRNGVYDTSMAIKEATEKGIQVFYILTTDDYNVDINLISNFNKITKYATDQKIISDPNMLPKQTRKMVEEHLI